MNILGRIRGFNWKGATFGPLLIGALVAFEVFNFSVTRYALADLLGDLSFGGMSWAVTLAVAFCGIDFAGIARIFTPEQGRDEPAEIWYLFGAWFLAAAMNAVLTWWGVGVAISNHAATTGSSQELLAKTVPIFVAAMVFVVRVLLINTFSIVGDRIFTFAGAKK